MNIQAFNQEIGKYAGLFKLSGLSVAVVHDGKIVDRQMLGYSDLEKKSPINENSIFWISSITKTFSAALIMQYLQEGKVSPDDYLIRYPFNSVGFFSQRIGPNLRLKHMLSHTSDRKISKPAGREYLWKAMLYRRQTGYDNHFVSRIVDELNRLPGVDSENESRLNSLKLENHRGIALVAPLQACSQRQERDPGCAK